MIEKAKQEIKTLIDQEKGSIEIQKAQTIKEIKREIADIVIASLEKIIDKKLNKEELTKTIKEISKE